VEVSGVAEAWFAVRTRARAEKAVRDYLGTRVPQVFLPTVTRWSRWKDRKKAVEWPLFTGYCFAHFDPADHFAVVTCPGVAGIISHAGKLAEVPDHEVESLRTLVTSEQHSRPRRRHEAPRHSSTTGTVRKRILMSSHSDHVST
jgi:transcription antitermination factor NusG